MGERALGNRIKRLKELEEQKKELSGGDTEKWVFLCQPSGGTDI